MGTPYLWQVKRVIDAVDPEGSLCFTGGEPTLRKELFSILKYTRKKHPDLYIFLVTNGRLFAYESFAKKLADLNLGNFMVGVALYGHKAEIHDKITRAPKSFEQTVKGIRNLIKHNIDVELRIIINKINYRTMPETAAFICDEFEGVRRVVFINMKYTGNAYVNRDKLFVRYKDSNPYVEKAVDTLLEKGIAVRMFHFPFCTIEQKYWEFSKGVTKQSTELMFVKACENCEMREECPRIWKTYYVLAGDEEFKPISLN
jgi:His-Xaa-Ser system radical SAM maturase HxsC